MLMEEMPPMSKLVLVDLGGEAEAHLPLDEAPADFVGGHLLEVDVLIEGTPITAIGAPNDEKGLVPLKALPDPGTVRREEDVVGFAVLVLV